MTGFSDLPNELIVSIWGYVIEPKSVENFALVSKTVYGLATPFVEEHQRLRQRYAEIYDLERGKHGRAAELLEAILLNPRIAVYVNELQIQGWANGWGDQDDSVQTKSYAGKTMDVFEDALRSFTTPSKAESLVADIRSGQEGPLLALILLRLTELKKLEIYPCYFDFSLDLILGGWLYPLEELPYPGRSTPERTRHLHNHNGAFLHLPKSFHISDLVIKFCDIESSTVSRLLRSTKNLKNFSYYGRTDSFVDPDNICTELLECSRQSLQKLCLEFNHWIGTAEKHTIIRDAISRLEALVEIEMDIVFFIDSEDGNCNTLMETLPSSIEKATFFSTDAISFKRLEGLILEMIKSKGVYLPNLKTLTFEQSFHLGPHGDTSTYVPRTELCDTELFAELSKKSAEVGVLLSVTKFENPNCWDDRATFRAYMS